MKSPFYCWIIYFIITYFSCNFVICIRFLMHIKMVFNTFFFPVKCYRKSGQLLIQTSVTRQWFQPPKVDVLVVIHQLDAGISRALPKIKPHNSTWNTTTFIMCVWNRVKKSLLIFWAVFSCRDSRCHHQYFLRVWYSTIHWIQSTLGLYCRSLDEQLIIPEQCFHPSVEILCT